MSVLGIDLGGTKLASAILNEDGSILFRETVPLEGRSGRAVGTLLTDRISTLIKKAENLGKAISSIGISVPGISRTGTGTVWAPNIKGWNEYPLMAEIRETAGDIPVVIDNDRACHILGEVWMGSARGCRDAVFLAVGTGIGAGILVNGEVLRGSNDIAGAIGWMALDRPFKDKYIECGCFEYHASGGGIAKVARDHLAEDSSYSGLLRNKDPQSITASDLFNGFEAGDPLSVEVIEECIEFWGMAVANLVSLFNPEKIILGGGVFGPAVKLIPAIVKEAGRWAQPVSITQMTLEVSSLGVDAGVYGAGYLALRNLKEFIPAKSDYVQ
jgi:glucokinase